MSGSGKLVLSRASENLLESATITIASGTELVDYEKANLADPNWAHPFKVSETSVDIRMNWASPVLPEFPVLGNPNLDVAATLAGNSTDSWGSPAVAAQAFGVPTMRPDGTFTSPLLDLRAFTAQSWWRLVVSGNTLPVILGCLWMGRYYREYDPQLLEDAGFEGIVNPVSHLTPFRVELTYQQAPYQEQLTGNVITDESGMSDLVLWARSNGVRARPFMVALNDAADDALMVKLAANSLRRKRLGGGHWMVELPFLEQSRGLPHVEPE